MYYIIHFYGIQIQLYGNKAPKLGNFKVYIDSEYQETASVYNDSRLTQQLIFLKKNKIQGVYNSVNLQFDYAKDFFNNKLIKTVIEIMDFKQG